jgi:dolichol-phosphate mannosyltransferase
MVSVVMPAWNEAEIIETCVREWYVEVIAKIPGSELIVVDDCSTDATGRIVTGLGAALPGVRCVRPERNGGHGKALRTGFDHARQAWVFQTDSDRQHLPADFWRVWEHRDSADFVFGVRKQRADGATRILITQCMRLLNLLVWGVWVRDANCPFKLMQREPMAKVLNKIPRDCFIPMVLVSILSRKMGFRVHQEEVEHLPRTGGTQSLKGLVKWLKVGARRQVMQIRWSLDLTGKAAAPAEIVEGA